MFASELLQRKAIAGSAGFLIVMPENRSSDARFEKIEKTLADLCKQLDLEDKAIADQKAAEELAAASKVDDDAPFLDADVATPCKTSTMAPSMLASPRPAPTEKLKRPSKCFGSNLAPS